MVNDKYGVTRNIYSRLCLPKYECRCSGYLLMSQTVAVLSRLLDCIGLQTSLRMLGLICNLIRRQSRVLPLPHTHSTRVS